MKDRVKALRTLLRIRERRGEALERELAQARERLAKAEEEVAAAVESEAACAVAQREGEARLDACTRSAFTPDAMRSLDLSLDDLKSQTVQAGKALQERRAASQRARPPVNVARAALERHERRLKDLREQIAKALREREALQEEQAEEEAEEAAAGRYAARSRNARAEASHG
jgi:chromosome segregation ATPase